MTDLSDIAALLERLHRQLSESAEELPDDAALANRLQQAIREYLADRTPEQLQGEQKELEQLLQVLGLLSDKAGLRREELKLELLKLKRSQNVKKAYGSL